MNTPMAQIRKILRGLMAVADPPNVIRAAKQAG
jgi:hypothetical protein